MARDYYEVLGVPRNASEKEVRAAYRRMARRYHPDMRPGDPTAGERFKEVQEAYEVLSDPEKRRLYDLYGHNWKYAPKGAPQGPFTWRGEAPTPEGFSSFEDLFGGAPLEDVFERFFGRGATTTRTRRAWGVVQVPVEVTLEEVASGTTRIVDLGVGPDGRPRRIEVSIPPGVDTGSQVRVTPGGREVILTITVRSHHRFQRRGQDLFTDVETPLYDALLGGEVVVPTLTGRVALAIPSGTQNGQVFRLAGQGLPSPGDPARRGDLYVTVKVVLPTRISQEERELLQRLKHLHQARPAWR